MSWPNESWAGIARQSGVRYRLSAPGSTAMRFKTMAKTSRSRSLTIGRESTFDSSVSASSR